MGKHPLFFLFVSLTVAENILFTTGISENLAHHEKPIEKVKRLSVHHKEQHKNFKTKNFSKRCSIICPFEVIFPTNSNSTTLVSKNVTTTAPDLNKVTTRTPLLDTTTNILLAGRGRKTANKKSRKSGSWQQKKLFSLKKNKLDTRKYRYKDLNFRQKHLLLKQLHLGNSHGKKAYKFKEINMSPCRVICQNENNNSQTATPERDSSESVESEESEDSYEEGEDIPIEATVKPFVPSSYAIGGIRPFGPVDFIGFDDFGPNGELSRDIPKVE